MAKILSDLTSTIIAGIVLAVVLVIILVGWHDAGLALDKAWWAFIFRWLHVLSGVMWIGILWYFNFVQIPNMGNIPDEQKPAITGVIAPAALFWFRWGAMSTLITGLILAWLNGYLADAIAIGLTDGVPKHTAIGIGMWLGTIMWFNVWFIIWPNQKKRIRESSRWQPTRKRKRGVPRCCSREPTQCSPSQCFMQWSQPKTCSDLNFRTHRRGLRAPFFFV